MLRFIHQGDPVFVPSGGHWAAPACDDHYRDTTEQTLQTIVTEIERGRPWREVVAERYAQDYPWLHRIITGPARDLFFRQHPPSPGAEILDVGAGWGQISLPLAHRPDVQVTALEPTPERLAFIRAAAIQEGVTHRLHFIQTRFQAIEFGPTFDLVCCIGVLEWVPKFQTGRPRAVQVEFLRRLRAALKPDGCCYLGIENRLGLKYLLGARDDHTAQRNISVLDANLAAAKHRAATGTELSAFTYMFAEYEILFLEAGFSQIDTYAAFPDYKLPDLILPFNPAEETNKILRTEPIPEEHDGIDGQRLENSSEIHSHYRSLAALGIAHFFAPSFYFVLR